MSQHDFNIANQGFPAFRSDLNDALLAVRSTNSGATAPTPTVEGMLWYDTATSILKRRNTSNTAWVDVNADTVDATTVRGNSSGSAAAETNVSMTSLRTMLGFSQSTATNGYVVLPGGVIIQWGTSTVAITTGTTITFPIVFPTSPLQVVVSSIATTANHATHSGLTASNFLAQCWSAAGTSAAGSIRYVAVGY